MDLGNTLKRILVLSDSLALPRTNEGQKVRYEYTYSSLLRESGYSLHQISLAGGTADKILEQATYFRDVNWDLVVIQFGIVDCTPRPFSKYERALVNLVVTRFPFTKSPILRLAKFLRRTRRKVYTDISEYKSLLNKLHEMFIDRTVVAMPIVAASSLRDSIFGLNDNITLYNEALFDEFSELRIDRIADDCFVNDGHHLNRLGHAIIFESIKELLRGL